MSEKTSLITIGMPIYNEEKFLRQTIDSILAQDYQNFELIISDNASEDNTSQICQEYAAKDKRIRYYRNQTNLGAAENFKKVVELAQGEFFGWASGHDIRQKTFLSSCVKILLQDESVVLCYPQAIWINTDNQSLGIIPNFYDTRGLDLLSRLNVVLWGTGYCYPIYGVLRARILKKLNLAKKVIGPDNILMTELSLLGTMAYVPQPLLYIRKMADFGSWDKYVEKVFNQHISNYSGSSLFWQMIEEHLQVVAKHIPQSSERNAATVSVVTCLLTKYRWLLKALLSSNAQAVTSDATKWLEMLSSDFHNYSKQIGAIFPEKIAFPIEDKSDSNKKSKITIIVDAVFFQMYKTGIARVWKSLLEEWAANGFAKQIIVLDRANTAPKIAGIRYRTVPAYDYNKTDSDRITLQQICDEEKADLFISTYYTTPISTPSVFMGYDMIPEVMQWDLAHPMWREKHYAIRHASAYITISENTARDLKKVFPNTSAKPITVAECGVKSQFSPASTEEINKFKTQYGIAKPYFILVGASGSYKNSTLFFQAFAQFENRHNFDIVCTGASSFTGDELKAFIGDSTLHKLYLNDEELKLAYSGAVALVYPSKYEGFGLPIIEALACGCPVITCANASIPEVAGEAAIYVKDDDVNTLAKALSEIQKPEIRQSLITAGLAQAKKFSWSKMADIVSSVLIETASNTNITKYQQNPTDQIPLDQIRLLRQQIAQQWLNLPLNQLESTYSGEIGKTHQQILNSAIKNEPLTDSEQIFVNQLTANIARGSNDPKFINYLLAAMLYRRADQLPLQYEGVPIPKWLLDDYFKFMLSAPDYFQEIGEVEHYYQHIQRWLDVLHKKIFANQNLEIWHNVALLFTQKHNFIPLYFTRENLKDIYTKRAEVMEFGLKKLGHQIDYVFPSRPSNRKKIRLGIINTHFTPQKETFTTIPTFEYLDKEKFEIILYATDVNGHPLEQYCQSRADKLVKLPSDLPNQVNTIRADDLDILLIGTNVTALSNSITLLALHRLARVQVTSVSSCVTTGMRNIDYYISGTLTEPEAEAQAQYQEKLITLNSPAHCLNYYAIPPEPSTVKPTRSSWGATDESVVFISGANFYKIIPEMRETWAKILAKVPNSILVLYPFNPNWSNQYPAAIHFINNILAVFAKYGIAPNRLTVIKALPSRADIKECLKLGDVYLDSYPFSGVTSLFDPLEVDLPPVVMDGNSFRSLMAPALLRDLQIPDLIAESEESYINLAINLATNPELRQQKRAEIHEKMQNNPRFLDSRAYAAQMGEVFQKLCQDWQKANAEQPTLSSDSAANNRLEQPLDSPQFIKLVNGCINLYEIDPSDESVLAELRLFRQQLTDFWLNLPPEQLETFYLGNVGKAHQLLAKSDFKQQSLTDSERILVDDLSVNLVKGFDDPKAINYRVVAMLYPLNNQVLSESEKSRLPAWLK